MRTVKLVTSCLLMVNWAMIASSRHLPSDEDLFADMLVMVNTSKLERHVDTRSVDEGSGYGDIPIHPLSSIIMERMEQAPAEEYNNEAQSEMEHRGDDLDSSNKEPIHTEHEQIAKSFDDEGSGDNEKGIEGIDMVLFKGEDEDQLKEKIRDSEVETVFEHDKNSSEEIVSTLDAPSEARPMENVENSEIVMKAIDMDQLKEGDEVEDLYTEVYPLRPVKKHEESVATSDAPLESIRHMPIENEELARDTITESSVNVALEVEVTKAEEDVEKKENFDVGTQEVDSELISSIKLDENTSTLEKKEILMPVEHPTETYLPVIDDSEGIVIATVKSPEEESDSSTLKPHVEESPESSSEQSTTVSSIVSSEEVFKEKSSSERFSEIPTTTLETTSEEATTLTADKITSPEYTTESSSEHSIISSSSERTIISSTSTGVSVEVQTDISIVSNEPEKESIEISTTTEAFIDNPVTILTSLEPSPENEPNVVKASLQIPQDENNKNSGVVQEGSIYKSLSLYVIAGILAIILIVLVIAFTMRYRRRRHRMRPDNRSEKDTENGILGNGKYQEDPDENNIKNNEITPLVIKNSSQINKFEKSPNFSSQKNINTAVNDKNIEKDNVLKSNQTIIEDEDDAKKCIEDEVDEQKKKSLEDIKQVTPEKVVVHTRVDLDSIPKKPVIINRNGHSYHAVPGGETET